MDEYEQNEIKKSNNFNRGLYVTGAVFLIIPFLSYETWIGDFYDMFVVLGIFWGIGIYFIRLGVRGEKEIQRKKEKIIQKEKERKEAKIWEKKLEKEEEERRKIEEQELATYKEKILKDFDKNGDGIVDDIEDEDDFKSLLKKHEKSIVEIDKNYIKDFIKVSSYLKTKKENIQKIFKSIKYTKDEIALESYVDILKKEVHSYNLVLFNSLNMVVALIENEMITFYEIYDSFDKLNIFYTNWENEVSNKLNNIGDKLDDLMYTINDFGESMIGEIGNLSYVTEESNRQLDDRLAEVDSSIRANNLISAIETYQLYKVNKNINGLKS
jgi:hypothetical protein